MGALPPELRFLKLLVTVLTAVMIAGVITIVALLVIRLQAAPEPVLVTPERFSLPGGVVPVGLSLLGTDTIVIGDDGVIRVFDSASGELRQEIAIAQ